MQPAIFLDRDGVINENRVDHVLRWDDFAPIPGALDALRRLSRLGLPIFVVTNQAVVGRGALTPAALDEIHARMGALAARHGGRITHVYACPHRPEERCPCRKPRPGLFLRAAWERGLDLTRSYYVGDALSDIAAGQAAGCVTIAVQTGRGRTQLALPEARRYSGYHLARDLADAARFIGRHHALGIRGMDARPAPALLGAPAALGVTDFGDMQPATKVAWQTTATEVAPGHSQQRHQYRQYRHGL